MKILKYINALILATKLKLEHQFAISIKEQVLPWSLKLPLPNTIRLAYTVLLQ